MMQRWVRWVILPLLGLFLLLVVLMSVQWIHFLTTPLNPTQTAFVIQVRIGQSMKQIAWGLKKQKRLASPRLFTWLVYLKGAAHRIQAGDYLVSPGITPLQLIEKMRSGEVILQRFTIVDGWTFEYLMKKIQENPNFSHTLKEVTPDEVMTQLGAPPGVSPEGQFYPDTYLFHAGISEIDILKKAYQKMQIHIQAAWRDKNPRVSYKTPYEGLVAASLIQKETCLPEEYAKVSAVIQNRLRKHMPLQMDPTVIYGLKKQYSYPLTQQQLTRDTPYNTYLRKGLPPTPIAMVNSKALYAAWHPDTSNVLYFVANGKGGHTFSNHLEGHQVAVGNYRQEQKQKNTPQIWAAGAMCLWVLGFAAYGQ